MTTEQKAKAYDEALKRAREWSETKNGYYTPKELCEEIFPELKESEDERIQKSLIKAFGTIGKKDWGGLIVRDILAWLKKQGELVNSLTKGLDNAHERIDELIQKNNELCINLEKQGEQKPSDEDMKEALRTEYEKGRADVIAEMQKEWSKEDEVKINRIVACLENLNVADNDILLKDVDWLKSLKDRVKSQNTWKPSDGQMSALKIATHYPDLGLSRVLKTLYNDLDKLTKE